MDLAAFPSVLLDCLEISSPCLFSTPPSTTRQRSKLTTGEDSHDLYFTSLSQGLFYGYLGVLSVTDIIWLFLNLTFRFIQNKILPFKPGFFSIFQVEGRYDYTSSLTRHHSEHQVHINGYIDNARVRLAKTGSSSVATFSLGRFLRALRPHDLFRNLPQAGQRQHQPQLQNSECEEGKKEFVW